MKYLAQINIVLLEYSLILSDLYYIIYYYSS